MIKESPFSVYDFLGYLIPGSLLIYAFIIIDYIKHNHYFKMEAFFKSFIAFKLDDLFVFILFSYTIGHLLSFASSITIERYANWRYSYPSKYLIGIPYKGYWLSSKNWKDVTWRVLLIFLLFPCVIFDFILGRYFGFENFYKQSLDPMLRELISKKVKILLDRLGCGELVSYDPNDFTKHDFHRIITHYAYENSKNHQAKMSNYVSMFGFLRNLCLIFNIVSLYAFTRVFLYCPFSLTNNLILFTLCSMTYLSFMAFMKFYRRYTLEGLMVIVIMEERKMLAITSD